MRSTTAIGRSQAPANRRSATSPMARPTRLPSANGGRATSTARNCRSRKTYRASQHCIPASISISGPWVGERLTSFMGWLNSCAATAPSSIITTAPQWEYNMSSLGTSWDQGMFGYSLGNTLLAPNPHYPNCRTCTWNGDLDCPGMYGLSSFHPGGGNVAMADGSVRFLKSSTIMYIVWSLGSRNGGEVVSADQY